MNQSWDKEGIPSWEEAPWEVSDNLSWTKAQNPSSWEEASWEEEMNRRGRWQRTRCGRRRHGRRQGTVVEGGVDPVVGGCVVGDVGEPVVVFEGAEPVVVGGAVTCSSNCRRHDQCCGEGARWAHRLLEVLVLQH